MRLTIAAALAALTFSATHALADDAGKSMFNGRCGACHQVADAKSGPAAPSLKGVYGRKIASLPDFNYSSALKAKGGTWTDANLDAWLSGPAKFAPGTKMFVAVTNAADRATLIGYLKTAK
jgi:cytochrome c